jgi:hypothetical protein
MKFPTDVSLGYGFFPEGIFVMQCNLLVLKLSSEWEVQLTRIEMRAV